MATPPFNPDETKPQGSDLISNYPAAERTFRDIIESWLLIEHNRDGQHDQVTLEDRDTAEPAGVSGHLTIFNDAGVPSFRDGTGVIQTFLTGTVQTADIADDAVSYAKMQDVSVTDRILGRITAGAGTVEELTGTQATTLLDAFTSSLKGLAPASGGGTTNFLRADGTWTEPPAPSSAMEFIASQDASDSADLRFTGFDATKYDAYVFELQNVKPANNSVELYLRTSTDGGASYDSGTSDYQYVVQRLSAGAARDDSATSDGSAIILTGARSGTGNSADSYDVGNAAGEDGVSGTVRVHGPHLAKETQVTADLAFSQSTGLLISAVTAGHRKTAASVDAVQFLFNSGNIASGTITMYGLKNS